MTNFFPPLFLHQLMKRTNSENMGHFHSNYNFWLLDKQRPQLNFPKMLIWQKMKDKKLKFDMLVFFTYLSLTEFQVWYLALFLLFSVICSFGWFLMGNLPKNIQLMIIITICHSVCLKAKIIWLWKLLKLSLSINVSFHIRVVHSFAM